MIFRMRQADQTGDCSFRRSSTFTRTEGVHLAAIRPKAPSASCILRRSFVLAGAKTLVMSLWKVPDAQTQELMEDFYTRLLHGQPRAEALREAQLAMKARHPELLYWGAFICQGELGPLPPIR